jgi:WD40 repeat protein
VEGDYILVLADHLTASGAAIWKRDMSWSLQLDVFLRGDTTWTYEFSPDGRYFVICYGGGDILIWDLLALQGEAPYRYTDVIWRAPLWQYMMLRFINNTTLEGHKIQQYWTYRYTIEIYQWDIAAGEALYYNKVQFSKCEDAAFLAAHPEPDLLGWACASIPNEP